MTTEIEKAWEVINAAPRKEQVHAAGCALHGIARGLNVPDETRAAIIAIAEWLKRSGWSSCQPEPTSEEFKQPERRHINEPLLPGEHSVVGMANGEYRYRGYRVFLDESQRWNVDLSGTPERYKQFDSQVQMMAWLDQRIADESYTPHNKRTVPDDIIEKIVDLRLEAWDSDEIWSYCRERMIEHACLEDRDEEIIEDADLNGYKLCRDINDNWVLIPEEKLK